MFDNAVDEDQGRKSLHTSGGRHSLVRGTDPEHCLAEQHDQKHNTGIMNPLDLFLDFFTQEIDSCGKPCPTHVSVQEFGKSIWTRLTEGERGTFARATEVLNRRNRKMGDNPIDEDQENNSGHAHKHEDEETDPFEIFLEYVIQEMKKQGMYEQLDKVEKREIAIQIWSEMMDQQKQPFVDAARYKDIKTRRLGKEEQEKVRQAQEKERRQPEAKKKAQQKAKAKGYEKVPSPCRRKTRKDDSRTNAKSVERDNESGSDCSNSQYEEHKSTRAKGIPKKPQAKKNEKREEKSGARSSESSRRGSSSDSESSKQQDEQRKRKTSKTTAKKSTAKRNEERNKTKACRHCSSDEDSETSSQGPSPAKKRPVVRPRKSAAKAKSVPKKRGPVTKDDKKTKSAPPKGKKK